jgi:hypothetical protein
MRVGRNLAILHALDSQGKQIIFWGRSDGIAALRLVAVLAEQRPTPFFKIIVKIAKPTVEISDKVRLNLEKFVWSSREK